MRPDDDDLKRGARQLKWRREGRTRRRAPRR